MARPRRPAKPLPGKRPAKAPPGNAALNRQTRKLLTQHYRAKHGVK